jgi:hypothetical protein
MKQPHGLVAALEAQHEAFIDTLGARSLHSPHICSVCRMVDAARSEWKERLMPSRAWGSSNKEDTMISKREDE